MASGGTVHGHQNSYSFKLVLLGEGAVGKTSVVLSYVEGKFNEKHTTTLQASFLTKKLSLGGRRVTLAIWDTAGQERFHALGPIYYRDSNGACLVYDVTDDDSFQKVKNWVKELRKILGSEICLVICGNKVDLTKERVVDLSTALVYADSVGAKHFETSAKTGMGIEEVFLFLSQKMMHVKDLRDAADGGGTGTGTGSLRRRQNVVIMDQPESQPEPAKRFCCG